MNPARVATYATIGAVLAWAAKALVIGMAGGLGESPAESPLFILGLVLYVVGVIAIGLAVTAGRAVGARVLGALVVFAIGAVASLLVNAVVSGLAPEDPGWAWGEAGLWIVSLATAAAWLLWQQRSVRTPQPA